MQEFDRNLFLSINGMHSSFTDVFWVVMTGNWAWLIFFVPIAYFVFKRYGKQGFIPALCVALLFLMADQGSNVAKYYFMRPRPCQEADLMAQMNFLAPHCGLYGFWSAHAANVFAQVSFFICIGVIPKHLRKFFYPYFILFALLVSFSRIMVGVHYPGDILAGMLYGVLCGLLVYALYNFLQRKIFKTV